MDAFLCALPIILVPGKANITTTMSSTGEQGPNLAEDEEGLHQDDAANDSSNEAIDSSDTRDIAISESYVSSASSASPKSAQPLSPDARTPETPSQPQLPPVRNTIANESARTITAELVNASARKNTGTSSDGYEFIPPVNPFFVQNFYDSDGSDGR